MSDLKFKCKNCGAYIEFNPNDQNFKCKYCGTEYSEQELLDISKKIEQTPDDVDTEENVYVCKNCGANIVMTDTKSAGSCYYCHSPIVMLNKLSKEYKPNTVIPFEFDKKSAVEKFLNFTKNLRYLPKKFFEKSQLENLYGVYYPYFNSDVTVDASFSGQGTTVNSYRDGKYEVTVTRYYSVERKGKIKFRDMFKSALSTRRDKMSTDVLPFDDSSEKEYSPIYLAGFMAERRDRTQEEVSDEVDNEIDSYIESVLLGDDRNLYATLSGVHDFSVLDRNIKYTLVPTWVITYRGKDKKMYYYSMNGQTGKTVGKFPINYSKLSIHSLIMGAVFFALAILGGLYIW